MTPARGARSRYSSVRALRRSFGASAPGAAPRSGVAPSLQGSRAREARVTTMTGPARFSIAWGTSRIPGTLWRAVGWGARGVCASRFAGRPRESPDTRRTPHEHSCALRGPACECRGGSAVTVAEQWCVSGSRRHDEHDAGLVRPEPLRRVLARSSHRPSATPAPMLGQALNHWSGRIVHEPPCSEGRRHAGASGESPA